MSKSKFYEVKSERLVSPRELLDELKDSDNLKSIDFIPPKIGSKGFGKFKVSYNTPVLVNSGGKYEYA